MNQDAFRQLLTTPHSGSSSSLISADVGSSSTKKAVLDPSQPAFRPRKVKKKASDSQYRDRAFERRAGVNEYAKVESVLEDFEQRTAENEDREAVEEQRRFLGGDKDHTILVKGLDYALLEQNKARVAVSHEDDDSLEVAFQEARSTPTVPKKRTREDIVRELKERRATEGTVTRAPQLTYDSLESAKKVGKFKPIGLPDESQVAQKGKKVKGKEKEKEKNGEGERRKKRRKVAHGSTDANGKPSGVPNEPQHSLILPPGPELSTVTDFARTQPTYGVTGTSEQEGPSEVEFNANVDIFEDVGDYEGVDLGEDDEDEQLDMPVVPSAKLSLSGSSPELDGQAPMASWFKEDPDTTSLPGPTATRSPTPPPAESAPAETELEPEQPARLAPLASSALPSISDFLAMDAHAEARKKKKMKKEKKKGEKEKVSTEVKVDRDYKKLNSYMTKKGSVKE